MPVNPPAPKNAQPDIKPDKIPVQRGLFSINCGGRDGKETGQKTGQI
jgi:hypothetical protein